MEFIKTAIEEAFAGMRSNDGGPFGAVVVKNGKIIARGHNEVIKSNDPTAHAKIVAIRKASAILKRFDLSDCEIYSSCEPCPMCLAAIHWAKIESLFYGCSRHDAAEIGFDDNFIYEVIKGSATREQVKSIQLNRDQCLKPFQEWAAKADKTNY